MYFDYGIDSKKEGILVKEYAKYEKELYGDYITDEDYRKIVRLSLRRSMKKNNTEFIGLYSDDHKLLGMSRIFMDGDIARVGEIIVFDRYNYDIELLHNIYTSYLAKLESIALQNNAQSVSLELFPNDEILTRCLQDCGYSFQPEEKMEDIECATVIFTKSLTNKRTL